MIRGPTDEKMTHPRCGLQHQRPTRSASAKLNTNGKSSHLVWLTLWCLSGSLLLLALGLGELVECQEEQLTIESRQAKEQAASENELADTIKYLEKLEKLDKYWSEVARPR